MDDGTRKASKLAPQDFISRMPDNVVTNILERLPLQDAVRTGILASNWRFKWTMLSQLVFDDSFFEYLSKTKSEDSHERFVISRLLLHLNGAITKWELSVDVAAYDNVDIRDEDISHWILFLSKKGITNLTIRLFEFVKSPFKLPTHLFSCLELKHLKLRNCCLNPPASFHGFPNLLSLELSLVRLESTKLGDFITRCPLLEILKLFSSGKLNLVEIAKLENLKILSFSLCDLDTKEITSSGIIFESVCSVPKLQELELNFLGGEVIEGFANKRLSIAFSCIKSLILWSMCYDNSNRLSCAFELISSFPNLHTLKITGKWYVGPLPPVDYKTTGKLQLQNVMFEYVYCSENELCLLKYLLACSPFLKKIVIRPHYSFNATSDEKLKFAIKLLKLHRASPAVDIDLS